MGKVGEKAASRAVEVPAKKVEQSKAAEVQQTPTKPALSGKAKSKAGLNDSFTSTQAAFKPGATPTKAAPLMDLGNPKARSELAATSQSNPVSEKFNNANDICAGAVVVSALLLQSGTDAAARTNANALRGSFERSSATASLAPEVRARIETALTNLEKRTVSKEDVAYLQQAAYAIGRGVPGEAKTPGLTTGAVAVMVADLVGSGVAFAPNTTFGQVFDGNGGHWVGSSGKTFINSAAAKSGAANVKAEDIAPSGANFSARIRVNASKDGATSLQVQTRYGMKGEMKATADEPDLGWQATITPVDPRGIGGQLRTNNSTLGTALSRSTVGKLSN